MSDMSDSFRRGFLYGMAAKGYTPDQFGELLEKQAIFGIKDIVHRGADLATATAIGLPVAVGALGGLTAAQLTRPSPAGSVEDVNDQELARSIRQQTRAVARRIRAKYGPEALKRSTPLLEKAAYGGSDDEAEWDRFDPLYYGQAAGRQSVVKILQRAAELARAKGHTMGVSSERYVQGEDPAAVAARLAKVKGPLKYDDPNYPHFYTLQYARPRNWMTLGLTRKAPQPPQTEQEHPLYGALLLEKGATAAPSAPSAQPHPVVGPVISAATKGVNAVKNLVNPPAPTPPPATPKPPLVRNHVRPLPTQYVDKEYPELKRDYRPSPAYGGTSPAEMRTLHDTLQGQAGLKPLLSRWLGHRGTSQHGAVDGALVSQTRMARRPDLSRFSWTGEGIRQPGPDAGWRPPLTAPDEDAIRGAYDIPRGLSDAVLSHLPSRSPDPDATLLPLTPTVPTSAGQLVSDARRSGYLGGGATSATKLLASPAGQKWLQARLKANEPK